MSARPAATSLDATDLAVRLVAHRGDQWTAVENSLAAFEAAAAGGARFVECDIQFDRELQPLVFHDHHLGRLFGRPDLRLAEHAAASLRDQHPAFVPLLLSELLDWLATQPQLTLFLEIKPSVLSRHRPGVIVRLLAPHLERMEMDRIVLISQSAALLEACSHRLPNRRGWVASSRRRPACESDWVFLDKRHCESLTDWKAEGIRVAVYTVNDATEAWQLFNAGADLVETNHFARLCLDLENGRY